MKGVERRVSTEKEENRIKLTFGLAESGEILKVKVIWELERNDPLVG